MSQRFKQNQRDNYSSLTTVATYHFYASQEYIFNAVILFSFVILIQFLYDK